MAPSTQTPSSITAILPSICSSFRHPSPTPQPASSTDPHPFPPPSPASPFSYS
ncbi:hypothetical protein SAICODRAFT_29105 [Saitoella complicata NRRL Y-17804]|uniref:uncharacterized protein n=1 Tax=Saitoella complicata (strain BCRC 22490 / CBS 7301 / JCM 7358 / NBRC 10748 / NRRL Y-17804) TaxID=698492 RepID=UPI000866EA6D|nr:uncharacterized protein SAICODRAFT_29105 [Saitoella complicata NRRL Y-17804]ODQ55551.1 hypothetical protein SAICODRAFT_29105 [Saitoella complicata NRRL Y-17804]